MWLLLFDKFIRVEWVLLVIVSFCLFRFFLVLFSVWLSRVFNVFLFMVLSIYMCILDSNVLLSLNEGFFVVVLIKVIKLDLIKGKNVFCWDLLKWCILFINNNVCLFIDWFCLVWLIVVWMFFMLEVMVDSLIICVWV